MRTHAALGARTLRSVHEKYKDNQFIAMGIDIAQSHREWWDGSGYPESLSGQRIPFCARIAAVADCYDALRTRRCYKRFFPHDEAREIILRASGTHFNSDVVAVFNELKNTFRDVRDQMNEAQAAREIEILNAA